MPVAVNLFCGFVSTGTAMRPGYAAALRLAYLVCKAAAGRACNNTVTQAYRAFSGLVFCASCPMARRRAWEARTRANRR